jgi:hypothetical protein
MKYNSKEFAKFYKEEDVNNNLPSNMLLNKMEY